MGSPSKDLEEQKARIRALLAKADSQSGLADVPIDGAAIFLNSEIKLEISNPVIPVLRADQIKDYVRNRAKEIKLSSATQRSLNEFLIQNAVYQEEVTE